MPLLKAAGKLVHFVHIPKTAGSTIETHVGEHGSVLLRHPGTEQPLICSPQHFHRAIYEKLIPASACDYAFTIVRNPFDRLFSEYLWHNRGVGDDSLPFGMWWSNCRAEFRRNSFLLDNHLRPQVDFLSDELEIFRFEEGIPQVCAVVSDRIGIPRPKQLPHRNRSTSTPIAVDARTIASIVKFYAADFEELGYSRDPGEVLARRGILRVSSQRLHAINWFVMDQGTLKIARNVARKSPLARRIARRIRQRPKS